MPVVVEHLEIGEQVRRPLIARGRIRLHALGDDRIERFGHRRIDRPNRRRRSVHPRHQGGHRRGRGALPAAEQQVVQHQPERINVRARVDRLALGLLGRHVLDRSDDGAPDGHRRAGLGRARDAEVHDERFVVTAHHDVGRLQIAVHDAGLVRGRQSRTHLLHDRERPIDRQPAVAPHDRRQVRSLHERHRDVFDAVELAEIVNPNDVLVRDTAGEEQLALEAFLDELRLQGVHRSERPNHFHGHGDFERLVPGLIDRAHPADAEELDDVIARPEVRADCERRCAGPRAGGGRRRLRIHRTSPRSRDGREPPRPTRRRRDVRSHGVARDAAPGFHRPRRVWAARPVGQLAARHRLRFGGCRKAADGTLALHRGRRAAASGACHGEA